MEKKRVEAQMQGQNIKLRYVLLKRPAASWVSDSRTRVLFGELVALRLRGYGKEYHSGVLPLGVADFIGVHHLVCQEREDGCLVPLLGYLEISLSTCRDHHVVFPVQSLLREADATRQLEVLEKTIARCDARRRDLTYYGSWTMPPDVRLDRALAERLKDIMQGVHPLAYRELDNEAVVTMAALKFRVERTFDFWGYERFSAGQGALPSFTLPYYNDAEVMAYAFDGQFSAAALEKAKLFRHYWENRIEISVASPDAARKAA